MALWESCKNDMYKIYKYVTTEEIEEIHKELSFKDQAKKDEQTLHVIISKEGSVVNNKFWTMFICNYRETLKCHI